MDPITILLIVMAFLLFKGGALSQFGIGQPSTYNEPPQGYIVPSSPLVSSSYIGQESQTASSAIGGATKAVSSLVTAGTSLAKAVPIIGAALAAISDALFAASAKRASAARDENGALAAAVPGWDQAVKTVVNAYNTGQITASQTTQLLDQVMGNYWSEVGPHIQSGRNGCSNGSSCPGSAQPSSPLALATTAPSTYCSGSIGAACCVGCASLQLSVDNINAALTITSNNGQAVQTNVQAVFPSKYGGISRPKYTVTVKRPSSVFSL